MTTRSPLMLPADREPIELRTLDGLTLVGELASPEGRRPHAAIVALHPLPTAGGNMDSHLLRKASWRLPALADIAVLRFNTRGTTCDVGTSEGRFDGGHAEAFDVAAAVDFARARGLPTPWLVGWSFGTELALKYGRDLDIAGIILLSPPLHRTSAVELAAWADDARPVIAVVPGQDDYLPPAEARRRFAAIPHATVIAVDDARHMWVGQRQTDRALTEIVAAVNPDALPLSAERSVPL